MAPDQVLLGLEVDSPPEGIAVDHAEPTTFGVVHLVDLLPGMHIVEMSCRTGLHAAESCEGFPRQRDFAHFMPLPDPLSVELSMVPDQSELVFGIPCVPEVVGQVLAQPTHLEKFGASVEKVHSEILRYASRSLPQLSHLFPVDNDVHAADHVAVVRSHYQVIYLELPQTIASANNTAQANVECPSRAARAMVRAVVRTAHGFVHAWSRWLERVEDNRASVQIRGHWPTGFAKGEMHDNSDTHDDEARLVLFRKSKWCLVSVLVSVS